MYDDPEHGQVFSKALDLVWCKVSGMHERGSIPDQLCASTYAPHANLLLGLLLASGSSVILTLYFTQKCVLYF